MVDADLYWLVGILEGEGTFFAAPPSAPNAPGVGLQMKDEDVIARVSVLLGTSYNKITAKKKNHCDTYRLTYRNMKAIQLMRTILPLMSGRRQLQIQHALASYDPQRKMSRWRRQTRTLCSDIAVEADRRIKAGESLRSVARSYGFNHETLRRKILDLGTSI